jgi:hypothetical protein
MNPSGSNSSQGSIKAQLAENLVQNTEVSINLGGRIITTTEDKVRLAVHAHLSRMQLKHAWITPAGILISVGAVLLTADFRDTWGILAASWKTGFFLVGVASLVWLGAAVAHALWAPGVNDFVELLRVNRLPSAGATSDPKELDLLSLLYGREWVLHYRPPTGHKRISFIPDGCVGHGQNNNERYWRVSSDKLELIQADGQVHSRFYYEKDQGRWIHTNDADTRSRNQYIVLAD